MWAILFLNLIYLILISYAVTTLEGRVNYNPDRIEMVLNLAPFCLILLLLSFPLYQLGIGYLIINIITVLLIWVGALQGADVDSKLVIAVCLIAGVSINLLFFLSL